LLFVNPICLLKKDNYNLSDLVGVYAWRSAAYRTLVTRLAPTDCLSDEVVYSLYGLTEEEIAIVEGRRQSSQVTL